MEPVHIFYKELLAEEENIFTLNISEKNEVENLKFSESLEYGVTGMTINPDSESFTLIKVLDKAKLKIVSEKKNTRFSKNNQRT